MYPQRELRHLAFHKAALHRRIGRRRAECAAAATGVAQPLAWLDRALTFWRRLSPFTKFAAVPLGFLLKRTLSPRLKLLGSLVKWAPLVLSAVRGLRTATPSSRVGPR